MTAHGSEAGFTLLELLVALTLLGFLSILLITSTRFGLDVWSRSVAALSSTAKLQIFEATLSRELSRAYPKFVNQGTNSAIAFEGQSDSITFLTPDSSVPGALVRNTIILDKAGGANALVERSELELGKTNKRNVLLRHVRSVAFAYYGASDNTSKPTWQKRWIGKSRLPRLIRVTTQLADRQKDATSKFMIAPRLSTDVGCVFDPLTKTCRGR